MTHTIDPSTLDILDRLTSRSITQSINDNYEDAMTPNPTSEVFIMKESTITKMTDKRWFGLVIHSIVIGIVSTTLPLTVYPFLNTYLNMEGTQTLSSQTLMAMAWVLKPFFEIFSGSVPRICGYHRRPYLVLGWLLCSCALMSIYWLPIPLPYFQDRNLVGIPLVKLSPTQLETITIDAPSFGGLYVLLMSIATVGFILADVASDSLVKELVLISGEDPTQDSKLKSMITNQRYIAMMCTFLFMGVGMSGFDYGGTFPFTIDYNTMMLIMGVISFIPIPFSIWMVYEAQGSAIARRSLHSIFKELWGLLQNRALNHVLACRFMGGVFSGISATPVTPIALYWAQVQPLNDNVVSFVAIGFVFCFLRHAEKKGWKLNYRNLIIYATVVALLADCVTTMSTIWNLVRSQWFWLGLPVLDALPSGIDFVILNVLMGEIADPSSAPMMRSLVEAVSFISPPVGLAVTKFIDRSFEIGNQDLMRDTTKVRLHATITFIIAYAAQGFSLLWILALPRYNPVSREWKIRHGTSKTNAIILVTCLSLCFVWSIVVHVLSVNDSTKCMDFAGGNGC